MRIARHRAGFSALEATIGLGLLATCVVLVGELTLWGVTEQRRGRLHQQALEAAANILETAQATPWDQLGPRWAEAQRLPAPLAAQQLHLSVQVEDSVHELTTLKRVKVIIDGGPIPTVRLTALRDARESPRAGGKP